MARPGDARLLTPVASTGVVRVFRSAAVLTQPPGLWYSFPCRAGNSRHGRGPVVQRPSTPACHAGARGFESRRVRPKQQAQVRDNKRLALSSSLLDLIPSPVPLLVFAAGVERAVARCAAKSARVKDAVGLYGTYCLRMRSRYNSFLKPSPVYEPGVRAICSGVPCAISLPPARQSALLSLPASAKRYNRCRRYTMHGGLLAAMFCQTGNRLAICAGGEVCRRTGARTSSARSSRMS